MSKLKTAISKTNMKPFNDEIKRLEQIINYLGLEIERHEEMLSEVIRSKIKAIKKNMDKPDVR